MLIDVYLSSGVLHFPKSLSLEGTAPWNSTALAGNLHFLQRSIHPRTTLSRATIAKNNTNTLAFTNFEGSPETGMLRVLTAEKDVHPTSLSNYQLPEKCS